MEDESIELFDEEANCPHCGYHFTARLLLDDKDQERAKVICPKCNEEYLAVVKPELKEAAGLNEPDIMEVEPIEVEAEVVNEEPEPDLDEKIEGYYRENEPQFCGRCKRSVTKDGTCAKCRISPSLFSHRDMKAPFHIVFFKYLFLILFVLFLLVITNGFILQQSIEIEAVLFCVFSFVVFLSFHQAEKSTAALGLIKCGNCKAPISPKSVFCIYCGQRVPLSLTKANKVGMVVVFGIIFIIIMATVMNPPSDIKIHNISYDRPSTSDEYFRVYITLTNDLRGVAYENDIFIEISYVVNTYSYAWEGGDIGYKEKVVLPYDLPLPENKNYGFHLSVNLYHYSTSPLTGERHRSWVDIDSIMIEYI